MTTNNKSSENDFNATIGNTVLSAADFTQSPDDNYFYTSKNPLLRYNVMPLCVRAGLDALNCQPALITIRSTKLELTTSARMTQNEC